MLLEHKVDGIIFVWLHADTSANSSATTHCAPRPAIVLVNGTPDVDAPSVSCDDVAASTSPSATSSSSGTADRLAIGPDRFVPTRRKVAGFTEAYARHLGENAAEEHIVTTLFTLEGGQVAAGELIDSGHTAIICGSDMMALGAVRAARQRNLAVPDDVSVVGCDDSPHRLHRPR